jgi:hypothetical protein
MPHCFKASMREGPSIMAGDRAVDLDAYQPEAQARKIPSFLACASGWYDVL